MFAAIARILLGPLISFGEKYLEVQRDREALKAGTDRVVEATRQIKLRYLLGRIPLFIAELATSLYLAAVLVDSTFPTEWLTPLELPKWFQPHFHVAVASVFGLATVERIIGSRKR